MGTWGPGIFSDDLACDLRDRYRDLIGDGLTGEEATDRLLDEWQAELGDPDVGPVFWLALAATQWKAGRLEERVKAEALRVISTGADLPRWEGPDPSLPKRRRAALEKLRLQLNSPQPPPRRIRKRFVNSCEWEVGEVLALRLLSGQFSLFRVIGYYADYGGTSPVCEFLDWTGDVIPSPEAVGKLKIRPFVPSRAGPDVRPIMIIGAASAREMPRRRITRLGIHTPPHIEYDGRGPCHFELWRWIDRAILTLYGLA
jgi:hypothetical protein